MGWLDCGDCRKDTKILGIKHVLMEQIFFWLGGGIVFSCCFITTVSISCVFFGKRCFSGKDGIGWSMVEAPSCCLH
jgi:hypothetical protein